VCVCVFKVKLCCYWDLKLKFSVGVWLDCATDLWSICLWEGWYIFTGSYGWGIRSLQSRMCNHCFVPADYISKLIRRLLIAINQNDDLLLIQSHISDNITFGLLERFARFSDLFEWSNVSVLNVKLIFFSLARRGYK
jgi:hypothetical protein